MRIVTNLLFGIILSPILNGEKKNWIEDEFELFWNIWDSVYEITEGKTLVLLEAEFS